ncbi:MAG: TadE/TadG family type IV pilus assembly protein [Devosia sp.]
MIRNIVLAVRRLRRDDEAVAAVEFALIVPFLITLYFGSIEAAALFTVDKRLSSISSTIGDLVAQWDPGEGDLTTGTGGDLTDYLSASTGIMTPYSTTGLNIVVSLVQVKDDGTTKVLWSKANASGTIKTVGNAYDDLSLANAPQMNDVSQGGCVVAAEVTYSYLPILGQVFKTALNLKHTNYFLPRYGSSTPIDVDTTPSPGLAADACTNQA